MKQTTIAEETSKTWSNEKADEESMNRERNEIGVIESKSGIAEERYQRRIRGSKARSWK